MLRLIIKVLIGMAGLWLAARFVPGFTITGWEYLLGAAILLGIVNAIIRPVLVVLTFPITIVTLGLFLLVLNGAMIGLVAWLLEGVVVDGLWPAILAAIVTGVVSWIGQMVTGTKEPKRED